MTESRRLGRRVGVVVTAMWVALCAGSRAGVAQNVPVGDPVEDYVRVLELVGAAAPDPFLIRPLTGERIADGLVADSAHPWRGRVDAGLGSGERGTHLRAAAPQIRTYWNSAYPWGQNDGAVWQGRGATVALTAGGTFRWGILRAQLRPMLIHTQNRPFTLAIARDTARNRFAYPWQPIGGATPHIDWPQRFGATSFTKVDLGETSLSLDWRGLTAGVSNETMWWGPGIDNAIIMSNNAPGIPRGFVGTSRPVDVGIGRFEMRWIWGRLTESQYFDTVSTNNHRYVTGLVAAFEPGFAPGLSLGGSRLFYEYVPDGGLTARDVFLVFEGLFKASQSTPNQPSGNDARDQLLSLFARWVLPRSGFEVYGEWARNDHSWDLRDFLLEPEHSEAFTLGFAKAARLSGQRILRVRAEATHLERPKTVLLRADPVFYVHYIVTQGYTQRGQVIGAGIGPGGDSQILAADLYSRWGRVGGFVRRQVHDNDTYYELAAPTQDFGRHDVDIALGASALMYAGDVTVWGTAAFVRELNRYYQSRNDQSNLHVELAMRWAPAFARVF